MFAVLVKISDLELNFFGYVKGKLFSFVVKPHCHHFYHSHFDFHDLASCFHFDLPFRTKAVKSSSNQWTIISAQACSSSEVSFFWTHDDLTSFFLSYLTLFVSLWRHALIWQKMQCSFNHNKETLFKKLKDKDSARFFLLVCFDEFFCVVVVGHMIRNTQMKYLFFIFFVQSEISWCLYEMSADVFLKVVKIW